MEKSSSNCPADYCHNMGRHKQVPINGTELQMKSVLAGLTEEVTRMMQASFRTRLSCKVPSKMSVSSILIPFHAVSLP